MHHVVTGKITRTRAHRLAILMTAMLPVAADGTELPAAPADAKPAVAERYQAGFDRAWAQAEQGRAPTMACGQVIGTAVGGAPQQATDEQARREAVQAADACYVRATVRFLNHRLDSIEAGETNCNSPIAAMAVHRASLGGFIDELGESQAEFDRRIAAAVGDRMRAACPDAAGIILGEQ